MNAGPALDGIRVLMVDDLEDMTAPLAEILTMFGATVLVEASAGAALATLKRERPDVLLSDISMPEHDGFWLIAQVRSLPEADGGATPAAALTGKVLANDRAQVLRAGFQYHVPKPVDPDHLAGIVALLALKQ